MKGDLKYHWELEQGTDEWFEIRKGRFTASKAGVISVNGVGLKTLCRDLVENMIMPRDPITNADMERGNELEPIARMVYEYEKGVSVREVGFVSLGDYVGCSPDGLVGEDGGIEIKCRNNSKHLARMLGGDLDKDEYLQAMMCMMVTGRKWWDCVNYNPNFVNSLLVERIYPDEKIYEKLRKGLEAGVEILEDYLHKAEILIELEVPKKVGENETKGKSGEMVGAEGNTSKGVREEQGKVAGSL